MRRIGFSLILVLALLLGTHSMALAITNGVPDGANHPYVGVLIFTDGTDYWLCSGALLSPTVVLTAGHCTAGAMHAWATFDTQVDWPDLPLDEWLASGFFLTGTAYTHPDFCLGCGPGLVGFDTYDVGVIMLDTASTVGEYAALPEPDLADTLKMGTAVDLVGYGVQEKIVGGGRPYWVGPLTRYYAPSVLVASEDRLSDMFLKLTANPGRGKGGICFGDSGGPDLLGGTNIVLGVNSIVTSNNCTGVTYSERVDLPEVLEFIQGFLAG